MVKTFFTLLLITFIPFELQAQTQPKGAASTKFVLGVVEDGALGCGCSLYRNAADGRNQRHVFVQDMDEDEAIINLDGKNVRLRPVDSGGPSPERALKVGDRSWETYAAGDVRVRIDYTVRSVCAPKDEGCEVTYYSALQRSHHCHPQNTNN